MNSIESVYKELEALYIPGFMEWVEAKRYPKYLETLSRFEKALLFDSEEFKSAEAMIYKKDMIALLTEYKLLIEDAGIDQIIEMHRVQAK